jgi:FkbM family methyltransferase
MDTSSPTIARRITRLLQRLPQSTANSLRFRAPFVLPRWFKIPSHVRVCGKSVELRFPKSENADSDFIECFLLNAYGLGNRLGEVHSILDIGANVGFFSLAAKQYYPRAAIHAYEPNPRVLSDLLFNTQGFDVAVFPEAVGAEEYAVRILDEGPSNEARARRDASGSSQIRQVSLATALERMNGTVDLLKLDCEGAEWEMLKADGCWDKVRHLRMEVHFFQRERIEEARAALRRIRFEIIHEDVKNDEMAMIWARRA